MDFNNPKTLRTTVAVVAGLVLVTAVVLTASVVMRSPPPPPASGDLLTVARFVSSSQFQRMPDTDKMPYMKRMRASSTELKRAVTSGALTREQYAEAYLNGWMARQLDHMQEYYSLPEAARRKTLMVQYAKPAAAPASKPVDPSEPSDAVKDDFIRDRVRIWPVEQREQWEAYRAAAKAAKSAQKTKP